MKVTQLKSMTLESFCTEKYKVQNNSQCCKPSGSVYLYGYDKQRADPINIPTTKHREVCCVLCCVMYTIRNTAFLMRLSFLRGDLLSNLLAACQQPNNFQLLKLEMQLWDVI